MKSRADTAAPAAAPPSASGSDEPTGLPWLHTWRRVYIFVLGCFVTWVALLLALRVIFS